MESVEHSKCQIRTKILLLSLRIKTRRKNHRNNGSFCSSPILQGSNCLPSWHILAPLVSYISYTTSKDTLTSYCVQISVLPCGSVPAKVTLYRREKGYNYRLETTPWPDKNLLYIVLERWPSANSVPEHLQLHVGRQSFHSMPLIFLGMKTIIGFKFYINGTQNVWNIE